MPPRIGSYIENIDISSTAWNLSIPQLQQKMRCITIPIGHQHKKIVSGKSWKSKILTAVCELRSGEQQKRTIRYDLDSIDQISASLHLSNSTTPF